MKRIFVFLSVIISSAFMHAQQPIFEMNHVDNLTSPGKTELVVMRFHFFAQTLANYTLQQFTFNTTGTSNPADILNAKVYYTGPVPVFENPLQFGSTVYNPNGEFIFYGNASVYNGHSYFWLVFDISESAALNNVIDAECSLINITMNPPMIPSPPSPAGNIKIVTPANNLYTIGAGGNFLNLHQAIDSLSNSVIGQGVTLELLNSYMSSSEIFPVVIPKIKGGGHSTPLTIRPQAGSDTIVISSSSSAAFNFNGAAYVNIDGRPGGTGSENKLKIKCTSINYPAVRFSDLAYSNTISNSVISSRNLNSGTVNLVSGPSGGVYWNKLSGCLLTNSQPLDLEPRMAVYSHADSGLYIKETSLEKCTIKNFRETGIHFGLNTDGASVLGCEIYQDTAELSITAPVSGIVIDTVRGSFLINGNKIYYIYSNVLSIYTARGIFISNPDWYPYNVNITNNFISLGQIPYAESNIYGIDCAGGVNAEINLFNNSIMIGGSSYNTVSSCVRKTGPAYHFKMADNLLINTRNVASSGGWQYSVVVNNSSGIDLMDYNNLYSSNSAYNVIGYWMGQTAATLADWKTITGKDQHSVSKPVTFVSNKDLHISGTSLGDFELAGILIPGNNLDIDGEPRPQQYPYMGADENLSHPLPVELTSFTAEVINNGILLKWSTASEMNNSGFEIERRDAANDVHKVISFTPGKGTTASAVSYSYEDLNLNPGRYFYRLKQLDFDGSFSYTAEIDIEFLYLLSYRLEQNYPNPFNPSTEIQFELPETGDVVIKVYNMLGQEVRTLFSGNLQSGKHKIKWDGLNDTGSSLGSGTYIYRMIIGKFTQTRKMILLK